MHELAEIFRDLGTLVGEQGQMIGEYLRAIEMSALMQFQTTLAITYSLWRTILATLLRN